MTEEEIQEEAKNISAFKEHLATRKRVRAERLESEDHELRLSLIKEELHCVKEMYKLAKTITSMNRRWLLDNIVEQGFDLGCAGALGEFKLGGLFEDRESQKEVWKMEAKKFANVGLQIAKFLFGPKNLRTEEWEERCADPMRFYLRNKRDEVKKSTVLWYGKQ